MNTPTNQAQHARHVPLSDVDKLRQDARKAAEVRALQTHPDVVALRVGRVRSQVDGLMWAGLLLGLAFTMVNVQTFAADGAVVGSLPWVAAWLLDPMVSLVLIAVLRAEQVTARWQVVMRTAGTGPWVKRTKVFAFAATYTMNTWQSWTGLDVSGIVLHSVPPAMVYLAAETGPILRDRLTEAVLKAARVTQTAAMTGPAHGDMSANATPTVTPPVTPPGTAAADAAATATGASSLERPVRTRAASSRPAKRTQTKPGRKLLADYVTDARASWSPGVEITPAWARRATGCSAGLSVKVARTLREEILATHPPMLAATNPVPANEGQDMPMDGREAA